MLHKGLFLKAGHFRQLVKMNSYRNQIYLLIDNILCFYKKRLCITMQKDGKRHSEKLLKEDNLVSLDF